MFFVPESEYNFPEGSGVVFVELEGGTFTVDSHFDRTSTDIHQSQDSTNQSVKSSKLLEYLSNTLSQPTHFFWLELSEKMKILGNFRNTCDHVRKRPKHLNIISSG